MAAWNDPFGERIRANVRRCDRCGAELDDGDSAYFTGLDMLCLDCAEAEAKAQAEQDTVETIQTRFHAMEQRGLTRQDIETLYDLLQDVLGDEENAIEDNLADMRVILDEWGEGYVAWMLDRVRRVPPGHGAVTRHTDAGRLLCVRRVHGR